MHLKSNSAFSLLEVLVAFAILAIGIVFVYQSFLRALAAASLSHNLSLAAMFAEEKLFTADRRYSAGSPFQRSETRRAGERIFELQETVEEPLILNLVPYRLQISWPEKAREEKNSVRFFTYLFKP
ncbi:MAG: type II secretion system GspH family protein [Candidatus Omnitrophica bacterium]|nr:type II secretion system GspH family protein [Candidatus Omnitrophota bacterium]